MREEKNPSICTAFIASHPLQSLNHPQEDVVRVLRYHLECCPKNRTVRAMDFIFLCPVKRYD